MSTTNLQSILLTKLKPAIHSTHKTLSTTNLRSILLTKIYSDLLRGHLHKIIIIIIITIIILTIILSLLLLLLLLLVVVVIVVVTLSWHAQEGYSGRPVCLSVCHALILKITDN